MLSLAPAAERKTGKPAQVEATAPATAVSSPTAVPSCVFVDKVAPEPNTEPGRATLSIEELAVKQGVVKRSVATARVTPTQPATLLPSDKSAQRPAARTESTGSEFSPAGRKALAKDAPDSKPDSKAELYAAAGSLLSAHKPLHVPVLTLGSARDRDRRVIMSANDDDGSVSSYGSDFVTPER